MKRSYEEINDKIRKGDAVVLTAEEIIEVLPPKRVYSFYHLMSEHAEKVCKARNYECTKCMLVSVCVRGQKPGDEK